MLSQCFTSQNSKKVIDRILGITADMPPRHSETCVRSLTNGFSDPISRQEACGYCGVSIVRAWGEARTRRTAQFVRLVENKFGGG
jgi:hypothetical protein